MTQQTTYCPLEQRADAASRRDAIESANLDFAWRSFRNELDRRIVARFGVASHGAETDQPDPTVLADLALQRALMP